MECAYQLYQINLSRWDPWSKAASACGCNTRQLNNE